MPGDIAVAIQLTYLLQFSRVQRQGSVSSAEHCFLIIARFSQTRGCDRHRFVPKGDVKQFPVLCKQGYFSRVAVPLLVSLTKNKNNNRTLLLARYFIQIKIMLLPNDTVLITFKSILNFYWQIYCLK